MRFDTHQSLHRQRRYPWLSIFDVTINIVLCSGVFVFACAILGLILTNTAPQILAQAGEIASRILSST